MVHVGAQAYELTLRQRLARGELIDGSPSAEQRPMPTLTDFVHDEWWPTYVVPNNRRATQIGKEYVLRTHLLPAFGHLRLDEITHPDIERFKAERLEADLQPQSINKQLLILRKCLQTAVDWGRLGNLPKIKQLKEPPATFTFLSPEECDRILVAAERPRWYAMILLALRTGMRISEIRGLDWSAVNLDKQLLTVRRAYVHGELVPPKSNRERHIPLTDDACEALAGLPHRTGFVFRKGSKPDTRGIGRTGLHRTCRRAGVRLVGWHVLRHSFASQLVAKGVPLPAIQQLLGHSTIAMTMRYAHLAPSTLREAVAVLNPRGGETGQPVGNTPIPAAAVLRAAAPRFRQAEPGSWAAHAAG